MPNHYTIGRPGHVCNIPLQASRMELWHERSSSYIASAESAESDGGVPGLPFLPLSGMHSHLR